MGRRNETGKPIQCHHCGYKWLTKSVNEYVPCPRCLYRVRNYKRSAAETGVQPDYMKKSHELI
jgi:predicted Zn-ribbon and HTH transcriptional regulator